MRCSTEMPAAYEQCSLWGEQNSGPAGWAFKHSSYICNLAYQKEKVYSHRESLNLSDRLQIPLMFTMHLFLLAELILLKLAPSSGHPPCAQVDMIHNYSHNELIKKTEIEAMPMS